MLTPASALPVVPELELDPHDDSERWMTGSDSEGESMTSASGLLQLDPPDDPVQWMPPATSPYDFEEYLSRTLRRSASDSELVLRYRGDTEQWMPSPIEMDSDSEGNPMVTTSELELDPPDQPDHSMIPLQPYMGSHLEEPGFDPPYVSPPPAQKAEVDSNSEEHSVPSSSDLHIDPHGDPEPWTSLTLLDHHYENHCNRVPIMKDIEKAIALAREALELCPHSHRDRPKYLNSLAVTLATRHEQLGEMENLNEAISLGRAALDLRPPGHRDRPKSLNNLALDLYTRFEKSGERADLDVAIVLAQEALDLCPLGHPDRPLCLLNLAADFFMRYKQFRKLADLGQAIVLGQEALNLQPRGHRDRSMSLNNVVHYISIRYELFGDMQDLDDSITLGREAADLYPQEHPDRPYSLVAVARNLVTRYEELDDMTDLDDAITLEQEVLDICPQGHPLCSSALNNLTFHLSIRYSRLRKMADLDKLIVFERETLDYCPSGHPDRPLFLNGLAAHLSIRFNYLSTIADLDEAIVASREAFRLIPSNHHPSWSKTLINLAYYLSTRFTCSDQSQDLEDLFNLYAELTHHLHIPNLSVATEWVNASENFNHPTILLAYETCLRLFVRHLVTSSLSNVPDFKQFTTSLAVDAFSACLRNNRADKAVEFLEYGRCVFWNQIVRLRFPQDESEFDTRKTLSDELARLGSLLHDTINPPGPDPHDLRHLDLEVERVVDNIQNLPGCHHFLLPLGFSELRCAASCGPVIIVNASQYGCDALVVFADRDPVHIPLQITRERVRNLSLEAQSMALYPGKNLDGTLRKIWDEVVLPIVNVLEGILPAQSRIWWCPTAEFTRLPLHAAGPHRSSQRNLSDIYISSYTSTLTTLIRDRRQLSNSMDKKKRFLAISPANSSGSRDLASASRELDIIDQSIKDFVAFTRTEGLGTTISRVSEELSKNEWVHLTCENQIDDDHSFATGFVLDDGYLAIQEIIQCKLGNAEFAFLSAASTALGDKVNPDEVIHVASAMQFAGFRSIIGTMWNVYADAAPRIASVFYENMVDDTGKLDHTRAAFALTKTMNTLVDLPLEQRVQYVHIGA